MARSYLASHANMIGMIAGASRIAQILSPSLVCYNIFRTGTTGKMDVNYLTIGLAMSILGYEHGVVLNDSNMILTNIICIVLHAIYLSIYVVHVKDKITLLKEKSMLPSILALGVLYVRLASDRKAAVHNLNWFLIYFFLSLFIANTGKVIWKRDAGSIPMPMTLARLFSNCAWYTYGVAIDEPSLQTHNLVPIGISLIQVTLAVIFSSPVQADKKDK